MSAWHMGPHTLPEKICCNKLREFAVADRLIVYEQGDFFLCPMYAGFALPLVFCPFCGTKQADTEDTLSLAARVVRT